MPMEFLAAEAVSSLTRKREAKLFPMLSAALSHSLLIASPCDSLRGTRRAASANMHQLHRVMYIAAHCYSVNTSCRGQRSKQ